MITMTTQQSTGTHLSTSSRVKRYVLVGVILLGSVLSVSGQPRELLREDSRSDRFSDTLDRDLTEHVIQQRTIDINAETYTSLETGDKFSIQPFDDKEAYIATVDQVKSIMQGTNTLSARIDGYPFSSVVLSSTGDVSLGFIMIPEKNEKFIIKTNEATGVTTIYEIDVTAEGFPPHLPSPIPPPEEPGEQDQEYISRLKNGSNDPNTPATIDLMIVYTQASLDWAANNGGINNIISQAMASSQLALDNSQAGITLNLVHSALVNYEESGNSLTDLRRLTFDSGEWEEFMPEVHDWRDQYGADVVVMLPRTGTAAGLGWQLSMQTGRPTYAFSLTMVMYANAFTMVHEIGHNMGAHHHRDQTSAPGPGIYDYSSGWRWDGSDNKKYVSVMTYPSGSSFSDGVNATRVPYFSNPSISHQSAATGHSTLADNNRTLKELKHVVAAYRPTASGGTIAITITADAKSKTYGDDDPEFTYTITSGSLDPGDELTGSLSRSTGENVGTYAIQKGSLSGGSKYQITFVPANLTITKKNIQCEIKNLWG
jgi:hypothetical protein